MSHQISFTIAADASADQVQAMLDQIAETFGITAAAAAPVATEVADKLADAPAGVALDSNGLPWDERIHASTKTQNKDGSWKKLKGVDDATVAAVTAELKQLMGAPAPTVTAPSLPPVTAPALPAVTAPALPPVQESPYATFTKFIGGHLHSAENPNGRLTSDWVNQVIELNGVPGGLANLAARPDLIPQIESQIKQALGL